MFDATIHSRNLARQFRDADFIADQRLLIPSYKAAILEAASAIGNEGFGNISLRKSMLRKKAVYGIEDFSQILVLRHITTSIKYLTKVKQDDRRFIVECIMSLSKEGVPFRLYKFDVRSFYESINPLNLVERLSHDVAFSRQSTRVVRSFFNQLERLGVSGLPRGLSISATLAEYLMQDYDSFCERENSTLYYSRFVDDICLITDGSENRLTLAAAMSSQLPTGLVFNSKSESFFFGKYVKRTGAPVTEHALDYLGYRVHISVPYKPNQSTPVLRDVWADISPAKVSRIKSRIAASMLEYKRSGSFIDLRDRIRLLTSNFVIRDRTTKLDRLSGIRFNYSIVDSTKSQTLKDLDRFLCNTIMSRHPRNRLRPNLTASQRQELITYSFLNGFNKKVFFHFSPKQLAKLTRCWFYV